MKGSQSTSLRSVSQWSTFIVWRWRSCSGMLAFPVLIVVASMVESSPQKLPLTLHLVYLLLLLWLFKTVISTDQSIECHLVTRRNMLLQSVYAQELTNQLGIAVVWALLGKGMEGSSQPVLSVYPCNEGRVLQWLRDGRREGREGAGDKGDDDITLHVPSQLKELRAVARHESVDHQHFLSLLRGLEQPMLLSVRTVPL